ncbi:MAG: 5'-nucleotidase C-terminal domain-containing protein [Anaerolineae bacterium]|nr:5'-nucleotidase C-terminal domain-containing protein [Anaerolineae bacterium]
MWRKASLLLIAIVLVASFAVAQEESFELTIMHTNDWHAAHQPQGSGNGGASRLASVVNQVRAEGGTTMLIDAGDRFTGTLFHTQYKGQDEVQVMNLLAYDVMTLGNHEFDGHKTDPTILENFVNGISFPVVTANVDFSAYPALDEKINASIILERGGQQIGVIGLTTPDSTVTSTPAADVGFDVDLVGAVQAAVDELTAAGINKIILITHIGAPADMELIPQLSGVDIVLGGHSHTLYSNTYTGAADGYPVRLESASGEPVLYGQAGANGLYVGRLDVEFDAAGVITSSSGDTILLSRYITPDAEMEALINELAGPIEELRATAIGATTDVELVGDRAVCRVEECNLGNVIADAMRAETGADIAIMNGGGIRADVDAGEITLGEVLTVQPFGNTIATVTLTGADVIAALENGVSRLTVENGVVIRGGANGRFPQVSGIRYTIDPTLEAGSRIVSVEVLGDDGTYTAIDPAANYAVVTNNFVRQGGDGYSVITENGVNPYDFGRVDYEVTRDYLVANSPITTDVEGRITYVNATVEPRQ